MVKAPYHKGDYEMPQSLEAKANLFFLFHSDSRLKEAGEILKQISVNLGCLTEKDFAALLGVKRSTVQHWFNGTRQMSLKSCEVLQKIVDEAVSAASDEDSVSSDIPIWIMPCDIPHERIRHLWLIAELLNAAGSEMTFNQVLDCLAD